MLSIVSIYCFILLMEREMRNWIFSAHAKQKAKQKPLELTRISSSLGPQNCRYSGFLSTPFVKSETFGLGWAKGLIIQSYKSPRIDANARHMTCEGQGFPSYVNFGHLEAKIVNQCRSVFTIQAQGKSSAALPTFCKFQFSTWKNSGQKVSCSKKTWTQLFIVSIW